MVSEITRGVKFRFTTELDPGAAKALEAIEKRVEAIQKRMHLTLDVTERGGRSGVGTGSSGGRNGQTAIDAAARAAERAMQLRERAAERAMRTEARWSRMAEAAVAKRERDEARAADKTEREAKRAAEAQIRELHRVERERQRARSAEFREAASRQRADARRGFRSDADFWRGFEQYGEDRARTRSQQEAEQRRQQQREERERRIAERDYGSRLRAGNRQLALLVRSGPQAVEQDRRRAEQARRQEERERRASERETEIAARRQEESQTRIREGIYGTVHAFGQLTRAAAQFGLVGQRDMARVLDTIFAVEGSINALQGAMGAARAIRGIRGAAGAAGGVRNLGPAAALAAGPGMRLAGHLLNRAGLSSFGVAGGLGLAGAGVTALAAGGIGLLGTIADRRRGVPGHVGGFWDTIGSRGSGIAEGGAGLLLRATAGLHAAFNQPYGLTKQEGARWKEQYLEKQVGLDFIPGARAALSGMKTERLQDELNFKRARQAEMDASHLAGFEQQFGHAHTALEFQRMARERNLMLRENRSPLTREGPLMADLHGRKGAVGSQIASLQDLQGRVAQERATAFQEGGLQRGGEFDTRTAAQLVEYEKQIRDLMTQQASINRDIQRTGIEGLKQQLELRKQMAEGAKNRFESALGAKQGLEERLGAMTPGQVAAIARIKQKAERGESLNLHEIERLEQGDERSQFLAGEAKRRRFRNLPESIRGTLGDVENFKFGATQGSMGAAYEGRDQLHREIFGDEEAREGKERFKGELEKAGFGKPPPVMVDAKYTNEIKVQLNAAAGDLANLQTQLSNELMPKIETAFQENVDRFADLIMERAIAGMEDKIRRQNQNNRAAAGN